MGWWVGFSTLSYVMVILVSIHCFSLLLSRSECYKLVTGTRYTTRLSKEFKMTPRWVRLFFHIHFPLHTKKAKKKTFPAMQVNLGIWKFKAISWSLCMLDMKCCWSSCGSPFVWRNYTKTTEIGSMEWFWNKSWWCWMSNFYVILLLIS